MCAVLWTIALIAGCALTADGAVAASSGAWLAVPVVVAVSAIFSYRAAVRCAKRYGQILYLVFDLHRQDLIRALGYVPPDDPGEEKQLIQAISTWLVAKDPDSRAPRSYREAPSAHSTSIQ
jgi:hypothetical protein